MTNLLVEPQQQAETTPIAAAPQEQFERYDTIDTPKIAVVGFVSAIVTFVVIVAAQALFFAADNAEEMRKNVLTADLEVEQAVAKQESRLASYRWVDAQAGVVAIPIDEAMQRVVAEHQAN